MFKAASGGVYLHPKFYTSGGPMSFFARLQYSLVPDGNAGSPTPTFTRATTAYQTDFSATLNAVLSGEARFQGARVVRNALNTVAGSSSEDMTTANWTGDSGTARTTTQLTTSNSTTQQRAGIIQNIVVASGGTFNLRVSVKQGGTNPVIRYVRVFLWSTNDCGVTVDLQTGAITNTYADAGWTLVNYGISATQDSSGWLVFVQGSKATSTVNGMVALSDSGAAGAGYTWAGNGTQTALATKWMIQDVTGQSNTTIAEYVSNGVLSAPYQGAGSDGIQYFGTLNGNTVSNHVVTQATGAAIVAGQAGVAATAPVDAKGPYGYLAEGASTNLFLQSQALATTSTSTNITAGNNDAGTTAPDGTTTATLLTATNVNGTTLQSITGTAASYTFSVWLKRKTGTGTVNITVNAGEGVTVYVAAAVTTSWQQFTTTQILTVAGYSSGIRIVTNGDAVWAWGAQTELGAFASTYIPTTTTALARNAEVDQYVSAGNIAATMSGTIQVAPEQTFGTFTGYIFSTYVDANNSTSVLFDGTNLIARKRIGGTNHDATIAWTPTANTVAKVGWRFDSVNGSDIWLNGTKGTNDSTTTAAQIGTNFQIGADGNSANQDNCMHRFFNAYPTSLSDAKMGALTT